ncbi:MAG: metallophosphoesterase [Oscillospiraceae bacterium]|nr:metallophosphoesterase [Oscillospiraceae bacterium]
MIFVTGDCHGEFRKFTSRRFPQGLKLTRNDFVIICGDFGGIWAGSTEYDRLKSENFWIQWLGRKNFTTLFIDGNHENHARLNEMPVTEWHGGRVHKLADSVMHLMRGEVYEIGGKRIFTFGGAASHDISDGIIDSADPDWKLQCHYFRMQGKILYRVKGVTWWEEELPSEEEMQHGLENLEKYGNSVDYIFTHCAPTSLQAQISDMYASDRLTDYLENVRKRVSYQKWFFGHYHDDRRITEKDFLLYDAIVSPEHLQFD